MTQREEHRSLYLSYLEYCNKHDLDRMASFYTSTIKVNEVPKEPAAVAAQFTPLFSAFPDWHWEIRNLVVEATISRCTSRSPVPTGGLPGN
jgi:predicted ester cyclase